MQQYRAEKIGPFVGRKEEERAGTEGRGELTERVEEVGEDEGGVESDLEQGKRRKSLWVDLNLLLQCRQGGPGGGGAKDVQAAQPDGPALFEEAAQDVFTMSKVGT